MSTLIARMRALAHDDEGQDLIEYALLAGLISLVAVATVTTAGEQVSGIFSKVAGKLTDVNK